MWDKNAATERVRNKTKGELVPGVGALPILSRATQRGSARKESVFSKLAVY